jgi:citrate synthase
MHDSGALPADSGRIAAGGLDGVVVADTRLSRVDGAAGELVLRGLPVAEAVRLCRFEDALALLWADLADTANLAARLGEARRAAFALVPAVLAAARPLPPAAALRAMLAALPEPEDPVPVVAAVPVFLAARLRAGAGLAPIAPDPGLGHAADLLRMNGAAAAPRQAAALDAYLVTVADHGLNASTFAARVVASTRAGMVPSVVAGLCALEGPLHGGAPGPVLDMLDAIGEPAAAAGWLAAELAAGRRLMGFGHRIYRRRDPRADVLKAVVATLDSPRIRLAEAVEHAALAALRRSKPDRVLETNVEFWTALLLDAVGLPRDAFTAVFAMGRVAGWTAHVLEQRATGRLIRPESRYVGPVPREAA